MSRGQASIEDVFDDDTDLPLPSRPLQSNPRRVLQSVDSESEEEEVVDTRDQLSAGPASPSQLPSGGPPSQSGPTVSDLTPYKKWTCIYPIYIDAKRSYGTGSRRVSREKSVWWPVSKDIAEAASRLGLGTLHEVQKCHPADWANPGRVRVQWKKDGVFVNPRINTKKRLLEAISFYIQTIKPELTPKPPFETSVTEAESIAKQPAAAKGKAAGKKGKAAGTKAKLPAKKKRLPVPPEPQPMLQSRYSAYSPALSSGVLVDTIKAGMNTPAENPAPPGAGGKGKRKVVRVRA